MLGGIDAPADWRHSVPSNPGPPEKWPLRRREGKLLNQLKSNVIEERSAEASKKTSRRAGLLSKVYLHSALLMMASVDPSKYEVMLLTRKYKSEVLHNFFLQ